MASHTCASREDYEVEPILADGCDRCAEHANESMLLSLDQSKINALWRRMLSVERGDGDYLSHNEATACRVLYHLAVFVERNTMLDPWLPLTGWPLVQIGERLHRLTLSAESER